MAKIVRGSFSKTAGSKVRVVRDEEGRILGTVTKLDSGDGYRICRVADGKTRTKKLLADAMKSIARSN